MQENIEIHLPHHEISQLSPQAAQTRAHAHGRASAYIKRETKGVWPSILCRLCGSYSFRLAGRQKEELMNILSACNSK